MAAATPIPASSSKQQTCWMPVPECPHDSNRSRLYAVGETQSHASQNRRAAIGAHHQEIALGGQTLQPHLIVHRDVIAEKKHVQSGAKGGEGLRRGVHSRDSDHGQSYSH